MLKIVIVEDEELVRRGIVLAMDWKSLGCIVVGDAKNGEEGLEVIRRLSPDVVITDIRMPKMDGIEMIRQLKSAGSKVSFVILTAFSDFDYAHSALKLGVIDYLLKPFSDEDLEETLHRVRKSIEKDKQEEKDSLPSPFHFEKGSKNKYVEKAVEYIHSHYKEDISVGETAMDIGISEGHLSRIFKKETGYTFVAYLTDYRIHLAMELLKDCGLKVYEVADRVGYSDITYFSTLFKKIVGVNPSEYQNWSK